MKIGMKKVMTAAFLSIVVLFLSSCAANTSSQIAFHEEAITKDQNDATVYIYRMPSFVGSAVSLPVKIDGEKVALLKQNAYAVFRAAPGERAITVGNSISIAWAVNQAITKKSRTLTVVPKGVYFLRSQAGVTFSVTREEALREIVNMKYDMGL